MTFPGRPAPDDEARAQGRVIGRYLVLDEIASGGMATVHLAHVEEGDSGTSTLPGDGFVAVKCMHAHYARDPDFVSMFLDEAVLCTHIRHENVVATIDVSQEHEELLLVLELVDGESLSKLVKTVAARKGRIPEAIASAVVGDMLRGLHAAHEATNESGEPLMIVHRDVSPHNVLVGTDGVARVLDFGVAKARGRVQQTQKGQLKGKLAYMSPEQARGRTVDRRSDLFAAGIVLWELLVGGRLFDGDNEAALLIAILSEAPAAPSTREPSLARFDSLVLKALAVDPEDRYPTALAMADAIQTTIPPATREEVAAWVKSEAKAALVRRQELLERAKKQVAELRGAAASTRDAGSTRDSAPTKFGNVEINVPTAPRLPVEARDITGPSLPRVVEVASGVMNCSRPTSGGKPPSMGSGVSHSNRALAPPRIAAPRAEPRSAEAQQSAEVQQRPPRPPLASPTDNADEAAGATEISGERAAISAVGSPAVASPAVAPPVIASPAIASPAIAPPVIASPAIASPAVSRVPHRDLTVPLFRPSLHITGEGRISVPPASPRFDPQSGAEGIASQVTSVTLTTTGPPPPMPKEHLRRLTWVAAASGAVGAIVATAFLIIVTKKPWADEPSTSRERDARVEEDESASSASVSARATAEAVAPTSANVAQDVPTASVSSTTPASATASSSTADSATSSEIAPSASAPKSAAPGPLRTSHGFLNRPPAPTSTAKPRPVTTSTGSRPKR